MTKKNKDFVKELKEAQQQGNLKSSQIKKSKSLESLPTKSPKSPETNQVKELKAQVLALTEQISRIKKEANQSVQAQEQVIKELTTEKSKLTDQNSELRINNLKQDNYFTKYQSESKLTTQLKLQVAQLQKDLTISQQDLKSAQRIIELRTLKPADNDQAENSFDYWTWIRMGSLALLIYLLAKDQEH